MFGFVLITFFYQQFDFDEISVEHLRYFPVYDFIINPSHWTSLSSNIVLVGHPSRWISLSLDISRWISLSLDIRLNGYPSDKSHWISSSLDIQLFVDLIAQQTLCIPFVYYRFKNDPSTPHVELI